MKTKKTDIITQNKIFLWIALATGTVLLIPLVAMNFTNQVNWTLGDFVIAGALLIGTGSLFVLVARRTAKKYRFAIAIAFLLLLLWLWIELAVGLFTNWGS